MIDAAFPLMLFVADRLAMPEPLMRSSLASITPSERSPADEAAARFRAVKAWHDFGVFAVSITDERLTESGNARSFAPSRRASLGSVIRDLGSLHAGPVRHRQRCAIRRRATPSCRGRCEAEPFRHMNSTPIMGSRLFATHAR
jgi:hypothetical protein